MVVEQLPKPASRQTGPGELFQMLRDGAPRTRAELASVTGQARSTVATRIDMLMTAGLIVTVGEAHSTGGRPPAVFAFSPESRVVLAVDLGATHARMALLPASVTPTVAPDGLVFPYGMLRFAAVGGIDARV